MLPEIRSYLDEVRSHLHLDPATEMQIVREVYTYFRDSVDELQANGLSESEATKAAIDSFGRPRVVARRMYEAHSKGSEIEAVIACLPHLIIAGLFISQLWRHPFWASIAVVSIVCVTLYGWWHGKPSWLYPWVGYSLLPLLIGGYAAAPVLGQAASSLFLGRGSFPSVWALLLVLALIGSSLWIIVSTTIRVVRRDWILASLMLVPLPIVGAWLLDLEQAGGVFQGATASVHQLDMSMALAFITLGVASATFVRLRQRVLKVGALLMVCTIAAAAIGHSFWGDYGFFGLLATSLLMLVFLLSPALIEAKIGHGEQSGEAWWESSMRWEEALVGHDQPV